MHPAHCPVSYTHLTLPGQGKFQPVHAFGLLCAQMQPVGLGEKFGAAEVPGGNVDLHGENSFRLVLHLV